MKSILLRFLGLVCLAILPCQARCGDASAGVSVTAGSLHVCLDDVYFTQKKGYVNMLFDSYPYAAQIKSNQLVSLSSVVQALIQGEGLKKYSKEKHFKVEVVEIMGRDEYGAPRWDQVKLKEEFLAEAAKGKVILSAKKGKP